MKFCVWMAPVHPAPLKKVTVADIAGEADARRAVETKAMLNFITVY